MEDYSLSVEKTERDNHESSYAVKIATSLYEVNVYFSEGEIHQFKQVFSARWKERSLCLGTSANAIVHWATDDNQTVSMLIGHDDETWDIGFTFPEHIIQEIIQECEQCA